jgi:hypothetical protein
MPPTLGQRREEESSRQSILDSLWLLLKMEAPSVQAKERLGYIVNQI